MACYYELAGHRFESELALDDFLLEKEYARPLLGDAVFEMSAGKTRAFEELDKMSKETKEIKEAFESKQRVSDDAGGYYDFKRPYIGVNKYISQFRTSEGKRISTEFIDENYWNKRFAAWAHGEYTDDEKEILFDGEEPIKIANPVVQEQKKNMIVEKWESQCLAGDAVHSVLQLYFSKNEQGTYYKDILNDPNQGSFKDTFIDMLKQNTYKRKNGAEVKFEELLNGSQIDAVLDKCRQLEAALVSKFGEDLDYFPEFEITAKTSVPGDNGIDTILGIIDLLVIDKDGKPQIIDYKTTVGGFDKFHNKLHPKKRAYTYQVGLYGRIIGKEHFNIDDTNYLVVPLQLTDFLKQGSKYTFSSVEFQVDASNPQNYDAIFDDVTSDVKADLTFFNGLNEMMDMPYIEPMTSDELLENVVDFNLACFKKYHRHDKLDLEQITQDVNDNMKKNEETGKWEYKQTGSNARVIKADSEEELVEKVIKRRQYQRQYLPNLVKQVKKGLKQGIEHGVETAEFPEEKDNGAEGASVTWFRNRMAKYCNPNWEVCDDPSFKVLESLGIIVLHNVAAGNQYDFVKVTTEPLKFKHKFGNGRMNLAGEFKSDIYYQSKQGSLMLENAYGNIELMEVMAAINCMGNVFGTNGIVGNIQVVDPVNGNGISASNAELRYCFDELFNASESARVKKVDNNFANGKISLGTKVQIAKTMVDDIIVTGTRTNWEKMGGFNSTFNSCKSQLDTAIYGTDTDKIAALEKVKTYLERGTYGEQLKTLQTDQSVLAQQHVMLYNQVLLALAELKGINFRQQLEDHSKWLEKAAAKLWSFAGTYFDNPGNLSSETLNLLTKLVTEAYLNVRADMQEPTAKMRQLVEALKKRKNFGWMTENTTGNLADLYKNLYEFTDDGDIRFKHLDDSSLCKEERDILEYALTEINKNRGYSLADPKYYQVPLIKGDSSSFASLTSWFEALKDRLRAWTPSEALKRAKETAEGIFTEQDEKEKHAASKLFEMATSFDSGEKDNRLQFIHNPEYYELNLETLTLKHDFQYSTKKRIDAVFPMIKASIVHLTSTGFEQNTEFREDIDYAEKYIRNKIKNESIVNPEFLKTAEISKKISAAASKMVLAFSPVLFFYQTLQGIWNDISLILRKPDGTNAFSWSNMLDAGKVVYRDMFHTGDKPTIVLLFNELYGVNDMDMNTYVDKIKTDQNGIHNLTNFMFKFASRPDYYNRMLLFVAKMKEDGCYDAHKIVDGRLVYDSKLDKRYAAFLNGTNPNSEEYKRARAAYYAVAKLFVLEGAKNADGTDFELDMANPKPLPRAYTNLEAESMKSISDTVYGYYSHEKKSMVLATMLGSMWMQFKTFWSGKKNQYLGKGGVKLEGKWVPYTEKDANGNTIEYYFLKGQNGEILWNEPPVLKGDPMASDQPVVRWEGNWKEGILKTIMDLSGAIVHGEGIKDSFVSKWYAEDESMRNAYRSNLIQLTYDLVMWGIIGNFAAAALAGWLKDEKKELKDSKDLMDGIYLSAATVAVNSVKNSFLDFNFVDSIGSPVYSWTPFSLEYIGNLVTNVYSSLLGDLTLIDGMCKVTSVGRQFQPFVSRLKENIYE